MEAQIAKGKAFDGATAKQYDWIYSEKDDDPFYSNDPLSVLDGVAAKVTERFEIRGITSLEEKHRITQEEFISLSQGRDFAVKDEEKLIELWDSVQDKLQFEVAPPEIDYREVDEDNPYIARYGGENWEQQIGDAPSELAGYSCVKFLVDHIFKETKAFNERYRPGKSWYFYYDALSLMTAKACIDYMEEKGYLPYWLLPVLGFQSGDKKNRRDGHE